MGKGEIDRWGRFFSVPQDGSNNRVILSLPEPPLAARFLAVQDLAAQDGEGSQITKSVA
jgi:hypothetical protein